jgi:ubiquinone/menaquinone biosynthesis C-methylase UbiE
MYKRVDACRCCGKDYFLPYLDLGKQPLANSYIHKKWKDNIRIGGSPVTDFEVDSELEPFVEERVELAVDLCLSCYHSQLSVVVDPEVMFKNYLYVSGTTQTLKNHFASLAVDTVRRVQHHEGDQLHVLDIACNDGTLLEQFRDLGCHVLGVDPAENLREITLEKKIPVAVTFWSEEEAKKLKASSQFGAWEVDVITACNVLAHVDNPLGFLKGARHVLSDRGMVIVEFPYGRHTFEKGEFDQVYHEHLSYFSARSFGVLAEQAGFYVYDVLQTPIHGGSIRFFLKKATEGQRHNQCWSELFFQESQIGLHNADFYQEWASQVEKTGEKLPEVLDECRKNGYTVVGYGASAKGNTMMNYCGATPDFIVDDNPLKWNHLTPGKYVPILSPEAVTCVATPIVFLLTAWNFRKEITQKIKTLRGPGKGDMILTYVPKVDLEAII